MTPKNNIEIVELSKEFVLNARLKKNSDIIYGKLKELSLNNFLGMLNSDELKKAFWMNVYNGHIQHLLLKNPNLHSDKTALFQNDSIFVAGQNLSLNNIEHAILRGVENTMLKHPIQDDNKLKYIALAKVTSVDGRIHFALNCGAKSCPYVGVYDYLKIDDQLKTVTQDYLTDTTQFNDNTLKISALFDWYQADFGSEKNIIAFIKAHNALPASAVVDKIEYLPYDSTFEIGNFIDI